MTVAADSIRFTLATEPAAAALVKLHNAVADDLTARFGHGHWSGQASERGVLFGMKHARVLLAKEGRRIVGSLKLQTKKPWAIDIAYFTPVKKALYLTGMAVVPSHQRRGLGRLMMDEARSLALAFPADAIRLDAYDADAGAGDFYLKCGYVERGRVVYRGSPLRYFELVL